MTPPTGRRRGEESTAGPAAGDQLPVDPDVPAPAPRKARRRAPRVLRDRWDVLLVIAGGGGIGSLGRWSLTELIPHTDGQVPWATLLANVTGSFILGALMVFLLDVWPPHRFARPFLGTGLLGGYTTFSTAMLDVRTLLASGKAPTAFGYLFGTLLSVVLAAWAGVLLARAAVAATERRHQRRHSAHAGPEGAEVRPADPRADPESNAKPDPTARSPR